jgi:UDP-N-acetylglucosamine--N-acetylmuramyl-(pentapeptide) pyrophosphoryl-undecaprenol N-acetylglucosamine transferase
VPFPGAGGHQKLNAKALEESGAAVVMDDSRISGESLSERIKELLADTAGLEKMSACARENAKPRAAEFISRDIVTILGGA